MTRILTGIVHGQTIEFAERLEMPEGASVNVIVNMPERGKIWGEGIQNSAGAWENYPEVDDVLRQIQEDRKRERRPQGIS